ncbi:hypothetical protein GCM10009127_01890 [Alteraurantiacibacter aestuarii]|uniref:SufD family Fe-S cluster assembly protein n=1 Tax=Alteraurantiacibacter aestuarii TaxID=650004 RepID=A0A844ZP08_9SPHN|nr:SufD family Fe-S cluster assembly protein [Alteraurantiacibacter aestuarii]MXO88557.1 SufD family Fe-S cluster assembly protein [Alteraurantiacibacter aestuarii]
MSAAPITQPVTRPTMRDEAWRYADFDAITTFAPEAFDEWREIDVAAGETFRECFILDSAAPTLRRIRINVAKGARAEVFAVNAAGDYARVELAVSLAEGAHFEFGGVTIGGGDATREFVTRLDHGAPDATSNQVVRSVHWGQATGNFLGRIDVGRDGQRTDAAQDFKAVLLERGASANARPELEIYADDVKCAHGAAIGQMDEMARYYMASRGIAPDIARELLIRAFIADAFAALDDEDARDGLLEIALKTLGER